MPIVYGPPSWSIHAVNPTTPTHEHFVHSPISHAKMAAHRTQPAIDIYDLEEKIGDCEQSITKMKRHCNLKAARCENVDTDFCSEERKKLKI